MKKILLLLVAPILFGQAFAQLNSTLPNRAAEPPVLQAEFLTRPSAKTVPHTNPLLATPAMVQNTDVWRPAKADHYFYDTNTQQLRLLNRFEYTWSDYLGQLVRTVDRKLNGQYGFEQGTIHCRYMPKILDDSIKYTRSLDPITGVPLTFKYYAENFHTAGRFDSAHQYQGNAAGNLVLYTRNIRTYSPEGFLTFADRWEIPRNSQGSIVLTTPIARVQAVRYEYSRDSYGRIDTGRVFYAGTGVSGDRFPDFLEYYRKVYSYPDTMTKVPNQILSYFRDGYRTPTWGFNYGSADLTEQFEYEMVNGGYPLTTNEAKVSVSKSWQKPLSGQGIIVSRNTYLNANTTIWELQYGGPGYPWTFQFKKQFERTPSQTIENTYQYEGANLIVGHRIITDYNITHTFPIPFQTRWRRILYDDSTGATTDTFDLSQVNIYDDVDGKWLHEDHPVRQADTAGVIRTIIFESYVYSENAVIALNGIVAVKPLGANTLKAIAYPNPGSKNQALYLELPGGAAQADIIASDGRRIRSFTAPHGKSALPTQGLSSGLYLLRLKNNLGESLIRIGIQ